MSRQHVLQEMRGGSPVVRASARKILPFYTGRVQTRATHSNPGKSLNCRIFTNEQISIFKEPPPHLRYKGIIKLGKVNERLSEFFCQYYHSYSKFLQVPYFSTSTLLLNVILRLRLGNSQPTVQPCPSSCPLSSRLSAPFTKVGAISE